MRIAALAGFAFFIALNGTVATAAVGDGWHLAPGSSGFTMGTGAVTGMAASQAVYIKGTVRVAPMADSRKLARDYGAVRSIPLAAWHGQRLRLALRLRNEGKARAWTALHITRPDNAVVAAYQQRNEPGDAWEKHMFVLDVPDNATNLVLNVGLTGAGTVWIDNVTLEAVDADVPVTGSMLRLPANGCNVDTLCSTRS